jgi:mannosyltransferase OCH1-like enzyme
LLDIEKSDYYRLQHLYEYGGIYSDFDNVINYKCLMKFIEPYRTQGKLVFMTATEPLREKSQQMNNNMIFAPDPKMPIFENDAVKSRLNSV